MHFASMRRYVGVLAIAAVVTVGVVGSLSLPRAYLLMATTTSTVDTGILSYLLPHFTADSGIEVRYIGMGTGLALDAGRRGNVDVVMVHAPSLELDFIAAQDGLCRNLVMSNRFIVVGPAADPAGIANATSAVDAFVRIQTNGSLFESRADDSGTHAKELEIWRFAGLNASTFGPWYERTGQGMGTTLTIANNKDAYTLSDNGTWYAFESNVPPPRLRLRLLYGHDETILRNQYSVIPVNPATHPGVFADKAVAFARWLVGQRGQGLIAGYAVGGHTLFTPNGSGAC